MTENKMPGPGVVNDGFRILLNLSERGRADDRYINVFTIGQLGYHAVSLCTGRVLIEHPVNRLLLFVEEINQIGQRLTFFPAERMPGQFLLWFIVAALHQFNAHKVRRMGGFKAHDAAAPTAAVVPLARLFPAAHAGVQSGHACCRNYAGNGVNGGLRTIQMCLWSMLEQYVWYIQQVVVMSMA